MQDPGGALCQRFRSDSSAAVHGLAADDGFFDLDILDGFRREIKFLLLSEPFPFSPGIALTRLSLSLITEVNPSETL